VRQTIAHRSGLADGQGWNRRGSRQATRLASRHAARLAASLACLLLLTVTAGCAGQGTNVFPTLGTTAPSQNPSTQPSDSKPTASSDEPHLTVALPLSEEATRVVRLLYLAKKSGLINQEPGQYIGQSINPDDLGQFDKGLTVTLDPLPLSTGATLLQVSLWQASAQLPDIIYCQDAVASLGLDQVIPLNSLLFDNPLLSAAHVYPSMLQSGSVGDALYGIPFLASTPLVYWNKNLLTQLGLDLPLATWTWRDWQELSTAAQQAIDSLGFGATPQTLQQLADTPELLSARLVQARFVTDNPAAALPFIPASISQSAGYALWNSQAFQMDDPSFKAAATWLNDYTHMGYSLLHLTSEQRLAAFGASDTQQAWTTGRILFWLGDSSDIASRQQDSIPLAAVPLPAGPLDGDGVSNQTAAGTPAAGEAVTARRLPLTVRSLFIGKQCQDPQLAADFAAFIALDADSLLMQGRYSLYEGMFPVIQDSYVWDALVGRQAYGSILHTLRDRLPEAYCSGQQQTANWQAVMQILEQAEGQALLLADGTQQFDERLNQLKSAVRQKTGG
jgi:ABC-type glycerol-3-phosphate transport system substrate-binding protein